MALFNPLKYSLENEVIYIGDTPLEEQSDSCPSNSITMNVRNFDESFSIEIFNRLAPLDSSNLFASWTFPTLTFVYTELSHCVGWESQDQRFVNI